MTDAKQACGTVQTSHYRMGKVPAIPTEPSRTLQAGLVGLRRDATQSHWSHLKVAFLCFRVGCQPYHGKYGSSREGAAPGRKFKVRVLHEG